MKILLPVCFLSGGWLGYSLNFQPQIIIFIIYLIWLYNKTAGFKVTFPWDENLISLTIFVFIGLVIGDLVYLWKIFDLEKILAFRIGLPDIKEWLFR